MVEVETKTVTDQNTKKRRIIQVAKEFHISVDSIVELLKEDGHNVKNHMSPVTQEMYDKIYIQFGKEAIQTDEDLKDDDDIQRKDQEIRRERERLDSVRQKIKEISEVKPPTLEEVQQEAIKEAQREKEEEDKRKEEAKAVKVKKKEEEQKKKEEEEKRKEEEEEKKALQEKKKKEQETRRLERLIARFKPGEGGEHKTPVEAEVKKEVVEKVSKDEEPKTEVKAQSEKILEEEIQPEAAVDEKEVGDSPKEEESEEDKEKRKKKKERVAEEKQKAGQKISGKSKKKKKKERKRKVSEEEVQAAIKKTMQAMEDKGKPKRRKHRTSQDDAIEDELPDNVIKVSEFISVAELANAMDVETNEVIMKCMGLGMLVSINQRLDMDSIIMIADEFEFSVQKEEMYGMDVIDELEEEEDDPEKLKERSPVVTIMGHVDHGKTSLLDYIRSSNIIAGEMGGITQHIGAYVVKVNDKKITFLDTPGHEAFTAMRARGAQVTDIVVIVIAAEDKVMPQTIEAINHARAANVPIIFAINKIDKPSADPESIKQQLSEIDILVEDWGGTYSSVEISAKTGQNVEQLMELLALQAEILELKANPDRLAKGIVIESELDKGRGPVATILVQQGTLKVGNAIIVGSVFGKVRAMFDERGKVLKKAPPSTPAQVLGFDDVPLTGDILSALKTERKAREISNKRQQLKREQDFRRIKVLTLDEFSKRMRDKSMKELKLIVKADVAGSVEALSDSLIKLSNEEVKINVIHKGVGAITETDVLLASASEAIIIGFQIRPNAKAWDVAENEKVDIRTYSIIYDAINDVKSALEGMLEPEEKEELIGVAEVREIFRIPKIGTIAGSYVQNGKIVRNENVRIVREGRIIYEGVLNSLKRFKEDAKEVQTGFECGIGVEDFNDIKEGDSLEIFKIVQVKRMIETQYVPMLGFYQLEIYIPGALSLKEKRFVLKSIKDRIRKKFNVSIAELDGYDKWQKSLLGIAMVSNDGKLIEGSFNKILNLIDNDGRVEVIDRMIEYY